MRERSTRRHGAWARGALGGLAACCVAAFLHLLPRPVAPEASAQPATARTPVPDDAVRAFRSGRFLRASLILRDYLSTSGDSTPEALLLAARAEAGWGNWREAVGLLDGRSWLESFEGGAGLRVLGTSLKETGGSTRAAEVLARYLEVASALNDRERGLVEIQRAEALRAADENIAALSAYESAAEYLPSIRDWIWIESADAAAEAGDTATVRAKLATIDATLVSETGWRVRVEAFESADDLAGAEAAAEAAASSTNSSNQRAQAWATVGRIRQDRGDLEAAEAAFRRAIATAPGGTGGVDGARMLSELPDLSPADHLLIGRTYLRHGNFDRGIRGLDAYLESSAGTESERAAVRAERARALYRAGRNGEAEPALMQLAEETNSTSTAAEALFLAARSQYRAGKQTAARQTFLRVVDRYPNTDAAAQAMYLSADLDHDDADIESAERGYRRILTMPSDVEEVGLAYMRHAGLAFLNGDPEAALETWDAYRTKYPNGRRWQQATYWSALSLEALGESGRANARLRQVLDYDPLSYYGSLSAQRLAVDFWDMPLRDEPPGDPALETRVEQALARADLLEQAGWSGHAGRARERARSDLGTSSAVLYTLAEALNARGQTATAIGIGWELFRREGRWNSRLLRIIYPLPFADLIVAEAKDAQVDPFLAAALIRQESMFNPSAVSGANAIGLMQVIPETGSALAHDLGLSRFSSDMLRRPDVNVHLGMRYLAAQLETYDGRLPFVLSAYNAGTTRADRWKEFPEARDDELFTERIPFAETRDYVKIVQQNVRIYAALYEELTQDDTQSDR